MIVKYLAALLICSGENCDWTYGSVHEEHWQCLYEIVELRPKYWENKTTKLVDCQQITSYKHEARK